MLNQESHSHKLSTTQAQANSSNMNASQNNGATSYVEQYKNSKENGQLPSLRSGIL